MNMHVSVCERINKPLPTLLITQNANDNMILNVKTTRAPQNLCIITMPKDTIDKLSMQITIKDNI